ncbi:hybrid-cluster NAD(P)-dependent oxidoreductase [Brevibacterium metallidurans]|uniref:Hybrid-cluster NAD(P)-dependent oxidoreductase n=1 Tax=Brevibacterium metallidurans TaxID=1482676 RepID=A0ABN0SJZ1_9MICO
MRSPFPLVAEAVPSKSTFRVPAWGGTTDVPGSTDDGITGLAECIAITPVTRDIISIDLRAPWLTAVDFEPGQYLTVRVPELGLDRCYSISSAPLGTNTFTLTVRRRPGGAVSSHLHDRLRVGDRLHVDGPYGLFSTSFHPARRHLFLSAGSGITPIMSMVRALLARTDPETLDVVLVHSASTPDDIVFRTELDQLAEVPGITVITVCSRDSATEVWAGRRGRLSHEILAEAVPDAWNRETFVCGPTGYMDAVRPLLAEVGVRAIHEESFVFSTSPAARLAKRSGQGRKSVGGVGTRPFSITFATSGTQVPCDAETTVLDAAFAAGMAFTSSCEQGMCGTCKSDLISGDVEMNHAGGIRPKELVAGRFLPCCSTPLSDLVVDR